ncbi:hypothetical protein DFP93_12735 [Aneurinibacillus soli]|uniref:Uncharacterized protein n=1 Tax=Aneurinibacillus soli TaxID=1500254 RepID=A0A0U5B9I8_9BACL|nr:hypothetical protein [Aneurinibacillus soli]PYE57928.1 hypothetical protein DFP93_12735 [Aneurinibacillus soli]BAU26887.1 hypothetical protein CB4_01056 [Aneurinibacillus soli]
MTRTAISAVYKLLIIVVTVGIPLLLYFGSGSTAGLLAAVLSFGVLASYALYADLLNRRN